MLKYFYKPSRPLSQKKHVPLFTSAVWDFTPPPPSSQGLQLRNMFCGSSPVLPYIRLAFIKNGSFFLILKAAGNQL